MKSFLTITALAGALLIAAFFGVSQQELKANQTAEPVQSSIDWENQLADHFDQKIDAVNESLLTANEGIDLFLQRQEKLIQLLESEPEIDLRANSPSNDLIHTVADISVANPYSDLQERVTCLEQELSDLRKQCEDCQCNCQVPNAVSSAPKPLQAGTIISVSEPVVTSRKVISSSTPSYSYSYSNSSCRNGQCGPSSRRYVLPRRRR